MQHTVRNLFPVALVLFTILLSFTSYRFFADTAVRRVGTDEIAQKRVAMEQLQAQVEHSFRLGDLDWVQETFAALAVEPDLVNAFLVGDNGEVLASSRRADIGRQHSEFLTASNPDLVSLRQGIFRSVQTQAPPLLELSDNGDFLIAAYPVALVGTGSELAQLPAGIAWLEKDLRPQIAAAREQVRLQTIALMSGVGFLAFCLAVLFHVIVTRRIEKLTSTMKDIATGELDARVRIQSNDEFGLLGQYFNDMLDRREAVERALNQSQRLRSIGTLASGIAHDFNNILQAIIGYTLVARSRVSADDEQLRGYLDRIEAAGQRAKSLVQQILSFARASDASYSAVCLQEVLEETMLLIRGTFPASIRIDVRADAACRYVYGDATQLQQVITNLCTNAMHAMEEKGGALTISLHEEKLVKPVQTLAGRLQPGTYAMLSVRDTGVGIPADNLDRLVDPFFTTKDVGKGTGLGLSIVHGVVSQAGGGMLIDSAENRGTTVTVLLPLADGCPDAAAGSVDGTGSFSGLLQCRLLLIDDEPDILSSTAIMLGDSGIRVVARDDAGQALDYLATHVDELDVVVVDYTMPKMTGLEFAARALEVAPSVPVILATGMLDHDEFRQRRTANVARIVGKPYDIDELRRNIQASVRAGPPVAEGID